MAIRYIESDGRTFKVRRIAEDGSEAAYYGIGGKDYEVRIIHKRNGSRTLIANGDGTATERLTAEIYRLAPNNRNVKTKIGEMFVKKSDLKPSMFAQNLESFLKNIPK